MVGQWDHGNSCYHITSHYENTTTFGAVLMWQETTFKNKLFVSTLSNCTNYRQQQKLLVGKKKFKLQFPLDFLCVTKDNILAQLLPRKNISFKKSDTRVNCFSPMDYQRADFQEITQSGN